jgi:hypothetical protein
MFLFVLGVSSKQKKKPHSWSIEIDRVLGAQSREHWVQIITIKNKSPNYTKFFNPKGTYEQAFWV